MKYLNPIVVAFLIGCVLGTIIRIAYVHAGIIRYPVGQSVPSSVYTEPFDPCDPAYKFMQIRYGEPNNPKWQAAPDDWVRMFGNNERTMLLQTVSELRVVVASQGRRLMALEDPNKQILKAANEQFKPVTDYLKVIERLNKAELRLMALEDWRKDLTVGWDRPVKDPNEVKR